MEGTAHRAWGSPYGDRSRVRKGVVSDELTIEPAGWSVGAEAFLAAVLDCVAQPVWVVDHEGAILFANPAAVTALGYDDLSQLAGRPSHETIHYKHPDGSPFPVEDCPMLAPRTTGATIHSDEDWFFRRDGSMFCVEYTSAPIDTPAGRGAVVAFTDLSVRRQAERAARDRDIAQARAADARAAQRRIIEAHDAARHRVTRDLHDGAQQQFVNAVVGLQLAQRKWDTDADRARELLAEGLEQAQAGIAALRDLAAGIHPAILTNRGLGAAIEGLAERLPLPIALHDDLTRRLPTAIEATAYFTTADALTNVVKHARATRAADGIRTETGSFGDRPLGVPRIAHDAESEVLEQFARESAERRVVVDDQHCGHGDSVGPRIGARHGANPRSSVGP
jgi:PAS domain S-box-containing protein